MQDLLTMSRDAHEQAAVCILGERREIPPIRVVLPQRSTGILSSTYKLILTIFLLQISFSLPKITSIFPLAFECIQSFIITFRK